MDSQESREKQRSLGELIKELRDESLSLLRQEVKLVKAEMADKANTMAANVASIAVGGLVAYAGMLFVLFSLVTGLGLFLVQIGLEVHAAWMAPLIVGAVVSLIGYTMVQKGINTLKKTPVVPEKAAESIKEDKQWLQSKVS